MGRHSRYRKSPNHTTHPARTIDAKVAEVATMLDEAVGCRGDSLDSGSSKAASVGLKKSIRHLLYF
jgi:hypothetical protein